MSSIPGYLRFRLRTFPMDLWNTMFQPLRDDRMHPVFMTMIGSSFVGAVASIVWSQSIWSAILLATTSFLLWFIWNWNGLEQRRGRKLAHDARMHLNAQDAVRRLEEEAKAQEETNLGPDT